MFIHLVVLLQIKIEFTTFAITFSFTVIWI